METSLVSGLLAASMAQAQFAIAAKMLRMNADAGASVAKMIEAAQQNTEKLANAAAAGIGQTLDISV